MRQLITLLILIVLLKSLNAQEPSRRFEFGSTVVTVNSPFTDKYFFSDRPTLEYLNGLFFRYTKKRLGLRAQLSYLDHTSSKVYSDGVAFGPAGSHIRHKDFRVGVGGQFSIQKQKEWFYACLDISYRYVLSSGYTYGPFAGKVNSNAHGADCFAGLGFKIKLSKNFNLSPEIGWNSSLQFVDRVTMRTGVFYFNPPKPEEFRYSETYFLPVFKLHLSVQF